MGRRHQIDDFIRGHDGGRVFRNMLASCFGFVPASLDAGGVPHQQRLRYRFRNRWSARTPPRNTAATYLAELRSIRHCRSAMVAAHSCTAKAHATDESGNRQPKSKWHLAAKLARPPTR